MRTFIHYLLLTSSLLLILVAMPVQAKGNDTDILFLRLNNPAQKYAYAGKLHWNKRQNHWDRAIVIYNNAPQPKKDHAVLQYVKQLSLPSANVKHQYNLYYKAFHRAGNCGSNTPLTQGRTWQINFDKNQLGAYSKAGLRADWNCPKWSMGNNLLQVVKGKEAYRGKALKLHYPARAFSCKNPKTCANWKPKLGGEFKQITYSYKLKLANNFDFVLGGKLPGVGGGIANTGGHKPNGKDGWSVRVMWNREGKLVQYVYHPDQPIKFGEAFAWSMPKPLQRGIWHTLKSTVTMNTPGQRNGRIQSWLDGRLVLNKNNIRFRDTNQLLIDQFLFASFYGGSTASWAPRQSQVAYFDEFVINANK
jgi:hypothetical protein